MIARGRRIGYGAEPRPGNARVEEAMAAITMTDIGERKRVAAKRRDRLISVASPVGLLIAWELAAQLHFIDTRFFPAPSSIVRALIATAKTGELWENTEISLQRMVFGFLLGGIPALG